MKPVVGICDVTIDITIEPAGPPHTYLGVATGFMPGIRTLAETSPLAALPLTMLCAHTLECILKAYLSRDGDDSRVMKRDVRHNLNKLWSMAHSAGLNLPPEIPYWVELLSNLHGNPYYLRYSKGVHALVLPPPTEMVSSISTLLEIVRAEI